jgi:hypothetical protein
VNAAALLKLADLLESLPPERFDYSIWAGDSWNPQVPLKAPVCGTPACALGWATTLPELGLELVRDQHCVLVRATDDPSLRATQAAARAFDIEENDAEYLFVPETPDPLAHEEDENDYESPGEEASAAEVAAHIRSFVKSREGTL